MECLSGVFKNDELFINVDRKPLDSESRNEDGKQIWNDGSNYEGSIVGSTRHGFGIQKWVDGESYSGQFCNDFFHGYGLYKWANGSFYLGTFYLDHKEGYGVQYKADGTCYEGLFGSNVEMGIGRLIYFNNDSMDIGFWKGNKLVKFFKCIPGFLTLEMPFFMQNKDLKNSSLSRDDMKPQCDIFNEELIKKCNQIALNEDKVFVNFLPKNSFSLNRRLFNEAFDNSVDINHIFFKDVVDGDIQNVLRKVSELQPTLHVDKTQRKGYKSPMEENLFQMWNGTISSVTIQKHILRHQKHQQRVSFDVNSLITKNHLMYNIGQLEKLSEEYFDCCLQGRVDEVKKFLKNKNVHVDVCDENGNSPLIGAAMNGHLEVVNVLLNSGADVNRMNDFQVTATMAACLKYYSTSGLLFEAQNFFKYFSDPSFSKLLIKPEDEFNKTNDFTNHENFSSSSNIHNDELGKLNFRRQKNIHSMERIWNGSQCSPEASDPALKTTENHSLSKDSQKVATLHSTMELLLKKGANPDAFHPSCSPIHLAIISGDVTTVDLLLRKGSNCESLLLLKGGIALRPLHCACLLMGYNSLEIIKLLLASGADVNSFSLIIKESSAKETNEEQTSSEQNMRRTSVELICMKDNEDEASQILQQFIDHNANINSLLENGLSPLALCLLNKKYELAKLLLGNGADPDLSLKGDSPNALCIVMHSETNPTDQLNTINMLVQHGADITLPFHSGEGKMVGNFVNYVCRLHRQETVESKSELPHHEALKIKRSRLMLMDYLSKEVKRKTTAKEAKKNIYQRPFDRLCHECGQSTIKSISCSRCESAFYCSKSCRNKSWKEGHKYQCSFGGSMSDPQVQISRVGHLTVQDNDIPDYVLNRNANSSSQMLEGFVSKLTFGKMSANSSYSANKSKSKSGSRKKLKQPTEYKPFKDWSGNSKAFNRAKSFRPQSTMKINLRDGKEYSGGLNYKNLSKYIEDFEVTQNVRLQGSKIQSKSSVIDIKPLHIKTNIREQNNCRSTSPNKVYIGNYSYI